jgi:hypothetical protein
MADRLITSDLLLSEAISHVMYGIVWTTDQIGYAFYHRGTGSDLSYKKTTDGGTTWGSDVLVYNDTILGTGVWFDRWTPGDSGNLIHIATYGSAADDVIYFNIDTGNSDTLSSPVTIFTGSTAASSISAFVSIAKMRGGNLYCAFSIDAAAETGFYRSTDGGASWGVRTNVNEVAAGDLAWVVPGNESDTNDCWVFYLDNSADALTLKVHDDSADTNSESSTIAAVVNHTTDGTFQWPFSVAIRHSDGHAILVVSTERDTATADTLVFDVNGTGSVTSKTSITTNIDDIYHVNAFIDDFTDDIYVAYNGKRDGSETLGATTGIYYTKSTDDGGTWSAGDTAYSAGTGASVNVWSNPNGPRFMPAFRINLSLFVNDTNALSFSAPGAGNRRRRVLCGAR